MEFCPHCEKYMIKGVQDNGRVIFTCRACACVVEGTPSDTLWFAQTSTHEDMRDDIIIERAGHDPAGKRILYDCQDCPAGRKYLTLVRKANATIVYTCGACGAIYDHHMQKINRADSAPHAPQSTDTAES